MMANLKKTGIPAELIPLMDDFARLLRERVPHLFHGLYLQGSIALGGYQSMKSDIDFIAVLNQPVLSEDDIASIHAVHEELRMKHPFHLAAEGLYTSLAHLSKTAAADIESFPKLFHGGTRALQSGTIDATSAWILKHHGVAVAGPESSALEITVEWDEIRSQMDYNLNVYWANKAERAELFMDEEWIEFAVLTLARIVHTLEHRDILTKLDAGYLVLEKQPNERRQRVIREAIRIREGTGGSIYGTELERALDVQRFVRQVIAECNAAYRF
ncbi:aminoglycoside adenylyltransferase domain-containing protein [Paenibacillus silvisoli]|uniref:aminoglycoside adenylyltransferase domain-containing protein n=1 Tax=Paenibacillus silvisoli TaxID=3110539 RepID=UPI002805C133|nr:aminoglycoside adenylyltransferase domain-containing protein [Paenibacillus silvisoli]